MVALLLLLFGWSPAPLAAGSVRIVMNEEAVVRGPQVLLGEVAQVSGEDSVQREKLAEATLGSAPRVGAVRNLSQAQARALLRSSGWDFPEIAWEGAPATRIRLASRALEKEEVVPVLSEYLARVTGYPGSDIEITGVEHVEGVEVPFGRLQVRTVRDALPPSLAQFSVPMEAVIEGQTVRTFWIRAEARIRTTLLKATRPIPFGKEISPSDFVEASEWIRDPRPAYARAGSDATGRLSRRAISKDEPLKLEMFEVAPLVKSGQTVQVILDRGGIRIETLARAEEKGGLGESIRIRTVDFKRTVHARVTGPGEVTIDK